MNRYRDKIMKGGDYIVRGNVIYITRIGERKSASKEIGRREKSLYHTTVGKSTDALNYPFLTHNSIT